jgi:integrase
VWQTYYEALGTKRLRNGLSGFIRYCNDHGISPDEVGDEIVHTYYLYLEAEGARSKPKDVYRSTCRLWNEVRPNMEGCNLKTLKLPDHRRPPWTVPWSELNSAFRTDVDAYLAWLSGRDLLAESPPPRYLKPTTLELRRKQIHGLVSAAIEAGIDSEQIQSLADLVEPSVVRQSLNHFLERYGDEPTVYIQGLAGTVVAIARHWVRVDQELLDKLIEFRRRLGLCSQSGLTEKNRDTLRQFESPANIQKLLQLPERLVQTVARCKTAQRQAVQIQIALAVEILLLAPMRIGNLVALRLDRHIQRPNGRKGRVFIVLDESETKNEVAQEYPLPPVAVKLLDLYLDSYRPGLVGGDNPWLFPGPTGNHKNASTLAGQIQQSIKRETGLSMTPHQFRHLSAKLYLDASPGSYETVRRVLGHKNIKNTVNFYAGMETRAAVEQYDQLISDLREDSAGNRHSSQRKS